MWSPLYARFDRRSQTHPSTVQDHRWSRSFWEALDSIVLQKYFKLFFGQQRRLFQRRRRKCVTEPAFRGHVGSMCGAGTGPFATALQASPHEARLIVRSGRHYSGRRRRRQRRFGLPTDQDARVEIHVGEESLPSLEGWDDGARVPGLQRTWNGRVREEKECKNCTLNDGPCTRVRGQNTPPKNSTKRRVWCQLLLVCLNLCRSVFPAKVRKCTLDQLTCPQNRRCWVLKAKAKLDAVQA